MSLNYDAKVRNQQEYSRSGNLGAVVAGRDFGVSELPQVDRIDWMYEQQVELTEKEQDEKMNQDAFKGLAEEQTVDKTGAGALFQQRASGSDLLSKVREDPMFQIKQEEVRRQKLIEANPLIQARLQAAKEAKEAREAAEREKKERAEAEKTDKVKQKEKEKADRKAAKKERKKQKKERKRARKERKREKKQKKKENKKRKASSSSSDSSSSDDSDSSEDGGKAAGSSGGTVRALTTAAAAHHLAQSRQASLFGGATGRGVNAFEQRQERRRERDEANEQARSHHQMNDRCQEQQGGSASSSGPAHQGDHDYRNQQQYRSGNFGNRYGGGKSRYNNRGAPAGDRGSGATAMTQEEKQRRLEEMRSAGDQYEQSKKKTLQSLEELEARKAKLEEADREKQRKEIEAGEADGRTTGFVGKMAQSAWLEQDRELKDVLKSRGARRDKNLTDRLERD
eukprot:g4723.t1